jgi:hypothetical protein
LIRQKIIEYFRGTDAEPTLDEVAARLGMTQSELLLQLANESPLTELHGLSMVETHRVVRQFAGLAIFSSDVEKDILEFTEARFAETRKKIKEIEQKAKGGKPPGSNG